MVTKLTRVAEAQEKGGRIKISAGIALADTVDTSDYLLTAWLTLAMCVPAASPSSDS